MATIVWPTSLPQRVSQEGFDYRPPDLWVRSESDVGPAQSRRRGTAGPTEFNAQIDVDLDQVRTLIDFFRQTLNEGAEPFEWINPLTDDTVDMKFTARPEIITEGAFFIARLSLEILP